MKRALIFGIGGQDGSYLAESLVADGIVSTAPFVFGKDMRVSSI